MASPSKFGKYELIRRIGVGGMAEVFLARTTVAQGLAKDLVIKKIHPAFARSRHFECGGGAIEITLRTHAVFVER